MYSILLLLASFYKPNFSMNLVERVKYIESITTCEFKITSANRSVYHNRRVGGAKNSYHLKKGHALDIQYIGNCLLSYRQMAMIFFTTELVGGVIYYKNHLHIDLRKRKYFGRGYY